MQENDLLDELVSLRKQGKIDEGIKLLKENTGKGKVLDPSDTPKMEHAWSLFGNPLLLEGQTDNFIKVCVEMYAHIIRLQDRDDARYHKGWSTYSLGNGFLLKALENFLLAFVEDTISSRVYPELALSTATLQIVFKVDSEFLTKLSEKVIKEAPAVKDPYIILSDLGPKIYPEGIPMELWTLEHKMLMIENKLRKFIEKQLSNACQDWWQKLIPDTLREEVDRRMIDTSRVLWFSEQPTSPLEYLSFPKDYINVIKYDKCWPHFKDAFKHKAILEGRLEGLGHIRHKIAHYRKISTTEKRMFDQAIRWLRDCLK